MVNVWLQILGEAKRADLIEGMVITALDQGALGVRVDAQHCATALRDFANTKEVDRGIKCIASFLASPSFALIHM